MPIEEYVRERGYSEAFVSDHLLPLVGAVWSSNREGARRFPARLLVRFFDNHGFLQRGPGWPWLTVKGGSREYVRAMLSTFTGSLRLSCPVERVCRGAGHVAVKPRGESEERFDHVIFACHADQALAILADRSRLEDEILPAFRFQMNDVVLHTDPSLMPRHRRAWSSWNYHLDDEGGSGASVTYWMNQLQSIPGPTNFFVTLNRRDAVGPDRVIDTFTYSHPIFTPEAATLQARHHELIDHQRTSYCGAYWRNGFHEDGVVSALDVADRLGATR
jgi:predicted NAD/FAD-binding protein